MPIEDIKQAVMQFNESGVKDLVQKEVDGGANPDLVLRDGLIGAMDEVGEKFSSGQLFVPEMLMAAQAMKAGLNVLRPLLTQDNNMSAGTAIIGTVKGDLHDIGKNLLGMMLEGAGFNVIDLGVNVESQAFVDAAREHQAQIVGLSALLTTTMPAMRDAVSLLKEAALQSRVMVGGAPVSQGFADEIGADGYSDDAPGAVRLAKQLLAG